MSEKIEILQKADASFTSFLSSIDLCLIDRSKVVGRVIEHLFEFILQQGLLTNALKFSSHPAYCFLLSQVRLFYIINIMRIYVN